MPPDAPFDPYDPHPALRLLHARNSDNKLFHLVKGDLEAAFATFCEILVHRRLRGGSGFIRDGYRCVCAGELPISQIGQYLADPNAQDEAYKPFGVILDKHWFFHQGGRPVVYQPAEDYELLHPSRRHLHMLYHPDREYDFSWIREWRILADELPIDLDHATAILPTRDWERRMLERWRQSCPDEAFPWHTVILEDIGVAVLDVDR